jgi:hypothetical protein
MSATESSASPCASQAIIGAFKAPDGARFEGRLCGCKVRLQYLARRLHGLGPKPLYYFLSEVERGFDLRTHLECYAKIDPEFVRALGGDKFPPPFLQVIDGGLAQ